MQSSRVFCKIRGNTIVTADHKQFDTQLPFKILGQDGNNNKYVAHVPKYFNIKNSFSINEEHLEKFNLTSKYLDERAVYIQEDKILRLEYGNSRNDGMFCGRCQEFHSMAEANQEDGLTFICYQCRTDPWR